MSVLKVEIESFSYTLPIILSTIQFELQQGEHLSILGESGGGKSTLLHLVYGLLPLHNGSIFYGGKQLLGPTGKLIPGEPFMKLVAQEFNIMPYATVDENIRSYFSALDAHKNDLRVEELLEVVELQEYKDALVKNLSGGQKQRVALAKALANEPKILLLDEPFSNIDSFKKRSLRRNLFKYLKEKNISCISATHDSREALAFSDNILMLQNGTVEMYGPPENIYSEVNTVYQAAFFDEASLLPKNILEKSQSDREVVVFPNQLAISKQPTALEVKVKKSYFLGRNYLIQGEFNGSEIFFENVSAVPIGTVIFLKYKLERNSRNKKETS